MELWGGSPPYNDPTKEVDSKHDTEFSKILWKYMPTDDNYSDFYGKVSIKVAGIIKIAQRLLRPFLLPNCFPLRDSNPMHMWTTENKVQPQ